MKTKTYKVKPKKKFQVTYGFERTGRKWSFRVGTHVILLSLRGGGAQQKAKELADALHESYKRAGKIDGPTRKLIDRINVPNPLRDYRPELNWT